ncbi:hypothetical protein MtrunA17_Chr2g0328661 [Medicago truncatula]|uniref:Uncharacterized protein n=1 Tax=Medicago truncatula TaxID=3880 RepID=Q2HS24_MEDTR|nr:hypothetical protein MtrDRAFT_AC157503g25v2 [Medicago truncatula]AES67658.1 hypothetical protein MTR_2g097770 [Medicago truncatula]RHN76126.1 hypothetical protein MtrunA17_Chr2g0328661 [Medicago truncatula]
MKFKTICFCLRRKNHKSKENEVEDLEKLSNGKPSHKEKNKGHVSTTHANDGAGNNVHGANTIASNDAGVVAAATVTAAHVSLMSQDGSGHGGESGGG